MTIVFHFMFSYFTKIHLSYHTKAFIWLKWILARFEDVELFAGMSALNREYFYILED